MMQDLRNAHAVRATGYSSPTFNVLSCQNSPRPCRSSYAAEGCTSSEKIWARHEMEKPAKPEKVAIYPLHEQGEPQVGGFRNGIDNAEP